MERRKHDSGRYPDRRRPNRSDDDTVITPMTITPTYDYSPPADSGSGSCNIDTGSCGGDWSGGGGGFDGGGATGSW